jgi:tetratricopeptide (TPR) repeat protein
MLAIALTLSMFTSSHAQTSHFRLQTADSLFQAKRYTQSLEHYEEILRQDQYTPAMLLKMAFIYEGLNQIGPAMYYLNLYYLATNDKSTVRKMDELATKYSLEGYETSDGDRFQAFYLDNHLLISLLLAALIILMLAVMYQKRMKLHQRPVGSAVVMVVLLGLLFTHQQFGSAETKSIMASATTYVMDGPSAGASVIDVVSDGHRVEVIGKQDVWMKIRWDDEVAYVKQNALRPVRL